jgi:hypothetical protein
MTAEKSDPPATVEALSGGAADFLAFSSPTAFHRCLMRYEPNTPLLPWRLSGCHAFKITAPDRPGPAVFACIGEDAAESFEAALRDDEEAQDRLRAFLGAEASPTPGVAAVALALRAPRELLLGSLFLPPRVECGKQVLETLVDSLSVAPHRKTLLELSGTWVAASVEAALPSGPKRLRHWYFFPANEKHPTVMTVETCKAVASCLFRGALPFLGEAFGVKIERPAVGAGMGPDAQVGAGSLIFHASVRLASDMPVQVLVDLSTIVPLLKKHCHPQCLAAMAKATASALPLALALNEALLSTRLAVFPRAFLDPRLGEGFFPFSAFSDLVTDRDVALVLQNHIPHALEGRTLRRLFSFSEQGRVRTPHRYREERLLGLMPQLVRDAWDHFRPDDLGSREELIRLNEEILAGIEKALRRNALILSPRARFILAEMVMPALRARARESLRQVVATGIPFASLRAMSRPQLQQLLGAQPTRTLCLSLVGAEQELSRVLQNVSAARAAELREDLPRAKKMIEEGSIEYEEVIRAKQEMEKAARDKMEQADKAAAARRNESAAPPRRNESAPPARR